MTAPTVTTPAAWKVTSPDSSAPARSNGAANQTEGLASMGLPAASFAAALNFTFWPTWTSSVLGVISTTAGATEVVDSCGLAASCDQVPGTENIATAITKKTALCLSMRLSCAYGLLGSIFQKSMPAACGPTSTVATVFNEARSITSTVPGSVPTPSTEMNAYRSSGEITAP